MLGGERDRSYQRHYVNAQTVTFPTPDGGQNGLHLRTVTNANGEIVGYTPNDNADLFSVNVIQSNLPYSAHFENGNPEEPVVMEISVEDLANITIR